MQACTYLYQFSTSINVTIEEQYSENITEASLYCSVTETKLRSPIARSKTDISEMALHE